MAYTLVVRCVWCIPRCQSSGARDNLPQTQASQGSQAGQGSQAAGQASQTVQAPQAPQASQASLVQASQAKPAKVQQRTNESLPAFLPFWGSFGINSTKAAGPTKGIVPPRTTGPAPGLPQPHTGSMQSTNKSDGTISATVSSSETAANMAPRSGDEPLTHGSKAGSIAEREEERKGEVSLEGRRLAALENCLAAFERRVKSACHVRML